MSADFIPYDSGFGKHKFNRLLKLIRKYRVLPNRPGWEQTPDGIMPPPIIGGTSGASSRPFQVTRTDVATVSVNTGYVGMIGSAWGQPSWTGGDSFGTDKVIASTQHLYLTFTLSQSRAGETALPSISSTIGWYDAGSPPATSASNLDVEIDFTGESVTETYSPETEYTTRLLVAIATFSDSDVSAITQYIDYNAYIPGNVSRFYEFAGV